MLDGLLIRWLIEIKVQSGVRDYYMSSVSVKDDGYIKNLYMEQQAARDLEREKHKDTLLVPIFGKYMKEVLIKRR